jgi:hypothetical protein
VRALVPLGLSGLLAIQVSVASAQTPDTTVGIIGTFHKNESGLGPLLDKLSRKLIPRQRWTPDQVVLATTATTFILMDWMTTADAIRRCQDGRTICTPSVEQNPLLGRTPSLATLRAWSLVGIGGTLAGGALLRRRWMRTAWFAGISMVEFMMVQHNVRAGLRLSLHF